jgi:hypothetical protein
MLDTNSESMLALDDSDLRITFGLQCEAELSSHRIPTAGVTISINLIITKKFTSK